MSFKKKIIYISVSIIAISYLLNIINSDSIKADKELSKNDILREIIYGTLQQFHYQVPEIDDNFSMKAFNKYLEKLDYQKQFLLQEDVDELKKFAKDIDNEINDRKEIDLYRQSVFILLERIKNTEKYYESILASPFDFNVSDTLIIDGKKRDYCKSEEELKERWRRILKQQALINYYNVFSKQEERIEYAKKNGEDYSESIKLESEIEEEARKKILNDLKNSFELIHKIDDDDRFSSYLNASLNTIGPHTEYFPPEEKDAFDIRISGQLEGIGAQLVHRDGYVRVIRIIPGSASWKQGLLKKEDIILKVSQKNEESISISEMALKDAVKLIKGPKGTEVKLTIQKPDGRVMDILIVRDVVIIEETYAKSASIQYKKNNLKYGYIYLPSFYSNFNNENGRNCSEDIKKILTHPDFRNTEGLVLDIRNNGGGSLGDVVKIAGLFIKKGPVVQVKSISKRVLYDQDSKIYYDKPIVILVNRASASASEILSAALQDYKRAIIIGSTKTYGKGSVQRFFNLDDIINQNYSTIKPLGSLKLTVQQFYRITGDIIQDKGVIPDIILPDTYEYINISEKRDYPLSNVKINPAPMLSWEKSITNKNLLIDSSLKRVQDIEFFNLVKRNNIYNKQQQDKKYHIINYRYFKEEQNIVREMNDIYNKSASVNNELEIYPILGYDGSRENKDSLDLNNTKEWIKGISKDAYINEAIMVLNDWIKLYQ